MTKNQLPEFYQIELISDLTITLSGSKPEIFRQVEVSSEISLLELHFLIQVVMGWTNSHLFQFTRGDMIFGIQYPESADEPIDLISADGVTIAGVLKRPGQTIQYLYDFGDSWDHKIKLNKHRPIENDKIYPRCIAGSGNCPPEDCGGLPGFYSMLDILKNPKDPEHKSMKQWVGKKYDPETFDIQAVNQKLSKFNRLVKKFIDDSNS